MEAFASQSRFAADHATSSRTLMVLIVSAATSLASVVVLVSIRYRH